MLIRQPGQPKRVVELEDEGAFASAMQQSEAVRRNAPGTHSNRAQPCVVVIVVSDDGKNWEQVQEFWRGAWRPSWQGGIPLPTREDLIYCARKARARYARSQIRSII